MVGDKKILANGRIILAFVELQIEAHFPIIGLQQLCDSRENGQSI